MTIFTILIWLLFAPFILACYWLVFKVIRSSRYSEIGYFILSILSVPAVLGIIIGVPAEGISLSLNPLLTTYLSPRLWGSFMNFIDFAPITAPRVIAASAIVFMAALISRKTRFWAAPLAAAVFAILALYASDIQSRAYMCSEAQKMGVSEFQRHSFRYSLSRLSGEFPRSFHAEFDMDAKRYAWSYDNLQWFIVDDDNPIALSGKLFECEERQQSLP